MLNITIDVSDLWFVDDDDKPRAKLKHLPDYIDSAKWKAGNGNNIVLTGAGPVWLYLAVAHALHGKALSLTYDSPASGSVEIFNHNPH